MSNQHQKQMPSDSGNLEAFQQSAACLIRSCEVFLSRLLCIMMIVGW